MNIHKRLTQRWLVTGTAIAVLGLLSGSAAQAKDYRVDFNEDAFGNRIKVGNGNVRDGAGELIDDEWADWGLNINGWNNRTNSAAKLLLYDTSRGGADNDLRTGANWGTASQGKVLIIQEKSNDHRKDTGADGGYNLHNPDDEARGGYINFDFDKEVKFGGFSLLDIDDNGGGIFVEGFDDSNNRVMNISVDALIALHKTTNGLNAADAAGKSVTLNGVTLTQAGNRWGDNSLFSFKVDDAHLTRVKLNYPGSGAVAGLQWSDAEPPRVPEPSATAGVLLLGLVGARRLRQRQGQTV
ncbi:MAG: PEP-CTERM sorting domain-containing protein [Leptolyngbya sp. SIO4C1]|nr:PEP-CTERM sorting domain-containing protein [Leptolyngbya sp. SIO4C1]